MKMFKSDNVSGVDNRILEYLLKINKNHENPYGEDFYSAEATKRISKLLNKEVTVYYVTSGTASNVIALSSILRPYQGVVCTDTAHINTDEAGAFERFSGSKILQVENHNGKIKIEDIQKYVNNLGDEHLSQAKVISISQLTELGTLYTNEEIKEIADYVHENNMYLHLDGARISNAVVALNTTFEDMVVKTGVDILSFGGTKNGMMIGEAIVCLNEKLDEEIKFHRKQGMQLLSKMRYLSAQFIPYIDDNIWYENAKHSNDMATYLKNELKKIDNIKIDDNLYGNMIFLNMDKKYINALKDEIGFNVINDDYVRIVTSFDTEKEEIDNFIKKLKEVK